MINLTGADSLVITLTDDPNIPLHAVVDFSDKGTAYDPADQKSRPNGTDPFEICAAPATGDVRSINRISVVNPNPESMAVTLSIYDGLDYFEIGRAVIGEGERVAWTHASDMKVNLADGSTKSGAVQDLSGYVQASRTVNGHALNADVALTPADLGLVIGTNVQGFSVTLAALAATAFLANTLPIGSSADAMAQVAFAANKFPARASTGNLVAKDITDFSIARLADSSASAWRTGLGLGTSATLDFTTSTSFSGADDVHLPSALAVKTYIDNAVTGLWDFKGSSDCSSNPNYPAASKGDAYAVSVAGKIGGASGTAVDIGDVYVASADSAGGTQASVGASWFILEHNLAGALIASNNLSDLTSASTARTNLGLSALATVTPGTGVATALAVNVGTAGAPVLFNGAGGTPSSLTGTNITGTASGLTAGNVTTNANLTGDVTSSGNATTLATVNSNVGSFTNANITVNAKGQVTAAANGTGGGATLAANTFTDTQTIAMGTITTAKSPWSITETRNAGGVTFPGLVYNVTETAAANGSALLDLQVGGTRNFAVVRDGGIPKIVFPVADGNGYFVWGTLASPKHSQYTYTDYFVTRVGISDAAGYAFSNLGLHILSDDSLLFCNSNTNPISNTPDGGISRKQAGVPEIHNGTRGSYTGTALLLGPQTFAQLPAAATGLKGARATVTDATATTYRSNIAGGGANIVPAFCDGTNWIIS